MFLPFAHNSPATSPEGGRSARGDASVDSAPRGGDRVIAMLVCLQLALRHTRHARRPSHIMRGAVPCDAARGLLRIEEVRRLREPRFFYPVSAGVIRLRPVPGPASGEDESSTRTAAAAAPTAIPQARPRAVIDSTSMSPIPRATAARTTGSTTRRSASAAMNASMAFPRSIAFAVWCAPTDRAEAARSRRSADSSTTGVNRARKS